MYCTWKGCALSQYSLVLKSSPIYATGPNSLSSVTTFLLQRNVASRILINFIAWVCLKIFSKIAYDSKYGTTRIDCARKMSSILGQNCPSAFRLATLPIQVTHISCPLLSPSLHTSLLTSFPPTSLLISATPLSPSRTRGGCNTFRIYPRKQSASTPNQRRFVISQSVRGFSVVCVFLCKIYCIIVPFCRYVQTSRYRFCACMCVYVRKECLVRREREM